MQLVRMNIVATRDLDDRTLSRQAFLNDPHLLSRCPPPAPLRAGKYRHSHRVCPLICKSMGKPVTSTANPIGGLHRMRTPMAPASNLNPASSNLCTSLGTASFTWTLKGMVMTPPIFDGSSTNPFVKM